MTVMVYWMFNIHSPCVSYVVSTSVFVYSYACNLSLVDRCVSVHVCVHAGMRACVYMCALCVRVCACIHVREMEHVIYYI